MNNSPTLPIPTPSDWVISHFYATPPRGTITLQDLFDMRADLERAEMAPGKRSYLYATLALEFYKVGFHANAERCISKAEHYYLVARSKHWWSYLAARMKVWRGLDPHDFQQVLLEA